MDAARLSRVTAINLNQYIAAREACRPGESHEPLDAAAADRLLMCAQRAHQAAREYAGVPSPAEANTVSAKERRFEFDLATEALLHAAAVARYLASEDPSSLLLGLLASSSQDVPDREASGSAAVEVFQREPA